LSQANKSFLVCDLETTNREAIRSEIISGHFMYLDHDLNIVDQYEFKSKPELWDNESEQASKIHLISYDDAMQFPDKEQAYNDLCQWLSTLRAGHFVAHGNRKIFGKFSTYDYSALIVGLFDTNYYFEFIAKFRPKDIISTHSLAKYLSLPSKYDLKSLAEYYKLGEFDHHDAKSDCVICYELLKNMLPQIDLNEFLESEYQTKERIDYGAKPKKSKSKSTRIHDNNSTGF